MEPMELRSSCFTLFSSPEMQFMGSAILMMKRLMNFFSLSPIHLSIPQKYPTAIRQKIRNTADRA